MPGIGCKKYISMGCILAVMALASCGSNTQTVRVEPESQARSATEMQGMSPEALTVDRLVEQSLRAIDSADFTTADADLRQAFKIDSADWRPAYLLGKIAAIDKESDRADHWFAYSLSVAPNEPEIRALIYEAMGFNCEQQGEYGKAKLHYTTALQLNPESGNAIAALKRLEVVSNITH